MAKVEISNLEQMFSDDRSRMLQMHAQQYQEYAIRKLQEMQRSHSMSEPIGIQGPISDARSQKVTNPEPNPVLLLIEE